MALATGPARAAPPWFPHVYGAIDRAAITGVGVLVRCTDGYAWPDRLVALEAFLGPT